MRYTQSAASVAAGDVAAGLADPEALALGAANSFLHHRLDHPSWSWYPHTPVVRSLAADSTGTPYANARSRCYLNPDGQAIPDGGWSRPVTLPGDAGVSWQIHLDEVDIPSGSTGAAALQVWDSTGTSLLSSTAFTATTTPADIRTATLALVAGTEYVVKVNVNPSGGGQASFRCGALRFVPVAPVSAFWGNPHSTTTGIGFVRYDIDATRWADTNEAHGYDNPRFHRRSEGARVDLATNAAALVVEAYNNIGDYIGAPLDGLSLRVDGYPLDPPIAPTIGTISYSTATMPAALVAPTMHAVTILDGPQAQSGLATPVNETRGSFPTAIYAAAGADVRFAAAPSSVQVIAGDSKLAFFYSAVPGRDSYVAQMRARGVRVIMEASGGNSLYFASQQAVSPVPAAARDSTAPGLVNLARKLTRYNPDKIHFGLGRNDFAAVVSLWGSTNNLVEAMRGLFRAIHRLAPGCVIAMLTWTHETTESDQDVTWEAARALLRAIPATAEFAPYCVLHDLAALWSVAEASTKTADGVHPNDSGQQDIAALLGGTSASYPWTPARVANLVGWYEFDAPGALTGTAMSTPVATGTTPPTLTLTGTPNAGAGALRIECTTAGARGTARFRWSVGTSDGSGRHWDATGVLTGATNALGVTGVTANWSNATFAADNVWTSRLKVASLADLSGAGNHMVQATSGAQPAWNPAADSQVPIVGPALVAPGITHSSSHLHCDTFASLTTYTIFYVGKATTASGLPTFWGAGAGSGTAPQCYVASATQVQVNDGVNAPTVTCTPLAQSVYTVVVNGASSNLRANGVDSACTISKTLTKLGMGANNGASVSNGTSTALLVYSGVVSAADILAVEAYLRAKYLAAGPSIGADVPPAKANFFAAASVVTAAAQYMPPSGATSSTTDTTQGVLCSGSGSFSRMSVYFIGSASNVGGQTVVFNVRKNGTLINNGNTTAAATNSASATTASITFAPIGYTDGDRIQVSFTPSGLLTAALTDVHASVS